jgi:hypothetical protein
VNVLTAFKTARAGAAETEEEQLLRQPAIPWRLYGLCFLLALVYVAAFSFIASVLHRTHGFPLDDSYIYQTVARNLAQHGRLGFMADRRSSGATSLIWEVIQAANYRFFAIDPVWYNLIISYLLLACIGPLLFLLCRRDALPTSMCFAIALAPAVMGNFLWLGLIGMEHLLFVVLSLAAIYFWLQPNPRPRYNALLCGAVVGLLAVTRPEDIVFGPFLIVLSFHRSFTRSNRDRLTVLGTWAPFAFLIVASNLWTSGSVMPATLNGRSWLYFHQSGGPHSLRTILRFLGSWLERIPRQFSPAFLHQPNSVREIFSPAALLALPLLALIILGALSLLVRWRPNITLLLLWTAAQFAIYLATFPAAGHGGRYQPLNLLLILPLLAVGLDRVFRSLRMPPSFAIGAVFLTIFVAGELSLQTWRQVTYVGIEHINNTEGQVALWLRLHVPDSNHFAAFDIGRVSFEWGGQVIDLGGLVDPSYYHYLTAGRVPEYLQTRKVEYLMLPGTGIQDMGFDASSLPHPVAEYCSPYGIWLLGFRYTIHATRCQDVYRLSSR